MKNTQTAAIGNRFRAMLIECMGIEDFAQMLRLNAAEPNAALCHSHDFCDPNQVMIDAFIAEIGREPLTVSEDANEEEKEADGSLFDAAWNAADLRELLPIGCIFDGAHGDDFNGLRIQELAAKYGWNGQREDDNSLEFQDAIDEATAYLEQFAPVGYYAAWEDGNYGVWKDESEYNLQTPCPSCGREDDGEWIAPCPADDCPSHWEEKGIAHPEHRTDF